MAFRLQNEARNRTVGLCVDKSWAVSFSCCNGHVGYWSSAELGLRFAREVTLEAIAARLKCTACGSIEGGLGIRQDESPEARANQARKDPGLPGFYRSTGG